MDCSTPGFPVLHHFQEFAQIHVHQVCDAIQPCHTLSSPSPPTFNAFPASGKHGLAARGATEFPLGFPALRATSPTSATVSVYRGLAQIADTQLPMT